MLLELRTSLEEMIQESDYYKNLYLDKGLINECKKDYDKLGEDMDDIARFKLSLAYFKCSI